MFESILTKIYYGNSVEAWAIALGIILGAFIVGKAIYWIFGNLIKKITAKTKTKLDDILVDMLEEPAMLAIILAGFWYGLHSLTLTQGVLDFFNKAIWVVIILNIAWFVSRFFEALVTEYLTPYAKKSDSDFDDQILPIVRRGVKLVIWILAIIVALDNAGYNIGAVLAGLGIGGIALAMAARDTVANIFGGIMIFLDKPFKIKDRIKIEGFEGNVEEIGIRSTRIKTLSGTLVTIPNSTFTENPVENITLEPARRVITTLGLVYDSTDKDLEKAMQILDKIAKKHLKEITDEYKIGFTNFGAFSLDISFTYYIKKESDVLNTQNSINLEILKEFNKNKLSFAFPTQTIEIKKS